MAFSKLNIVKFWIFTTLSITLTMAQNEEQRHEYYMKKWSNIKWHSTKPDDYYDVMETDPPTLPPEAHVPIYFDNCTEKYIGEIIFKEFLPMKFTIKRNQRLQKVLRTNFEDAEAFSLFIVSEKFIGVDDWKVREQMVINALKKDMPWDVRGLALILTSKFEYEHVPDKITENKLKKFAAMLHTKQLIIESGYRNITTTLSSMEHYRKMEELADRIYGPIGHNQLRDDSNINEEERQLAFDYNEYVETMIDKNTDYALKRADKLERLGDISLERQMKNDSMLRDCKKIWTLTSYERGLQEFSKEENRFKFFLHNNDLDRITPSKFYYSDKYEEELSTMKMKLK